MRRIIFLSLIIFSIMITGCIRKTTPALKTMDGEANPERMKQEIDPLTSSGQAKEQAEEPENTITVEGTEPSFAEATEDKGWRVYEKKEMNIRLLYHKDWYYDRDEEAEKELGHDLYVGFAESPEILEQGRPYQIELIITSGDQELHQGLDYSEVVYNTKDLDYILATTDEEKYKEMVDKMAESFEFINN